MTEPVFCDKCNTAIRLEADQDGTHILRCGCNKDVAIPRTWEYDAWSRKN